eukprot:GHVT01096887.1.p1 GENE.GHVT01096887.1~~GHVT01096887.1.p1  ORF type:complete len:367 (+),score=85.36 GHVT01096887.1:2390-3490(+)
MANSAASRYLDEQAMELEALESLFPHEGELCKDAPATPSGVCTSFSLRMRPVSAEDEDATKPTSKNHVGLHLHVSYGASYPDVAPTWEFRDVFGLEASQISELEQAVEASVESSLGISMVFTMADCIQAWLRDHNHPPMSMHEEMLRRGTTAPRRSSKADRAHRRRAPDSEVDSDYVPGASDEGDSQYSDDGGDDNFDDSDSAGDEALPPGERPKAVGLQDRVLVAAEDRVGPEEFTAWAKQFRIDRINEGIWKGSHDLRTKGPAEGVITGRQFFEAEAKLGKFTTGASAAVGDADATTSEATEGDVFWKNAHLFSAHDNLDDVELPNIEDDEEDQEQDQRVFEATQKQQQTQIPSNKQKNKATGK